MNRITVISIVASVAFLLGILELVRRRKLREEYSILWLFGSGIVLVLSVKQDWLSRISSAVGIAYPPSLLFLVGMLFIVMILVHFSIAISKLMKMNKEIVQQIAMLKRSSSGGDPPPGKETR